MEDCSTPGSWPSISRLTSMVPVVTTPVPELPSHYYLQSLVLVRNIFYHLYYFLRRGRQLTQVFHILVKVYKKHKNFLHTFPFSRKKQTLSWQFPTGDNVMMSGVSKCLIRTTSFTLHLRIQTARITLQRNSLLMVLGKFSGQI